jgi:hypothetical protein
MAAGEQQEKHDRKAYVLGHVQGLCDKDKEIIVDSTIKQ